MLGQFDDYLRHQLQDDATTTVKVPAWTEDRETGRIEKEAYAEARDTARDSIAVVRLFQRSRTMVNVEDQMFGLAVDIGSAREHRWVTDRAGRFISTGTSVHGSLAQWEVSRDDMAAFETDPRFAYLDLALRTPDARWTDWQRRAVTAVRTFAITTPLHRPSQRIINVATALEALVGNQYRRWAGATGGHQLARRGAFAWCGLEFGKPHGPSPARGACAYLAAKDGSDLNRRIRECEDEIGVRPPCSYYDTLRELSEDRNAAVHGANDRFTERQAQRHEFTLEMVILAVLARVTETGMVTLADYEVAIRALPEVSTANDTLR